jgi:hypothetical protein
MVGRIFGVGAVVLAVGVSSLAARSGETKGVLTGVSERSLQVTTQGKEVVSVNVDAKTSYLKWVTHKPWQADNLDSRSIATGRCVSVEKRADGNGVADVVLVNVDDPGSIWDPCKTLR